MVKHNLEAGLGRILKWFILKVKGDLQYIAMGLKNINSEH